MRALIDGGLRRVANVLWRIEIWLANAKRINCACCRTQRSSTCRNGERGARLNRLKALSQLSRHTTVCMDYKTVTASAP